MFRVGQAVNTKYGSGVVVCVGSRKPRVYVRVPSRSGGSCLYVFDATDVSAIETDRHEPTSGKGGTDSGEMLITC
jgi:hypothetical protein